jgi:hypothetical protein
MKQKRKRRLFSRENIGIFVGMVISLVLAKIADRRGLPHKWYPAIFGTTVPFVVEYCVVRVSGFCECYWTTQLTVG